MNQAAEPRLILASQSEARATMLRAAGLVFEARPARIDEDTIRQSARADGLSAAETAALLAEMKAARIRDPEALVIGSDQILVCGDLWFDKPADLAQARTQLQHLRGRTHHLVTAVMCMRGGQHVWSHVETPVLEMRPFSDAFLDAYLAAEGDGLLGSVGCYRLEGPGVQLFETIQGNYHTILGLPLMAVLGYLRQAKVLPT